MKAFQLKIAIKNSHPPIWRRVIVPAGITFSQLSMILNEAMGWWGYHSFEIEFYHLNLRVTEDSEDFESPFGYGMFDFDYLEASTTYIREYLEENDWFTYTYDLGDNWEHRVTIEKVITDYEYDYPQVIKYKGDCPLEDSGGIYGYYECLNIIGDKNHPEYEERLSWMESQGYPQVYNMDEVNAELKKKFFYRWGKGETRPQGIIYEEHFQGKYGLKATKKDQNKDGIIYQSKQRRWEEKLAQIGNAMLSPSNPSLEHIFSDYDKESVLEIAEDKGVKGVKGCNKKTIIKKLIDYMMQPEIMRSYFLCLFDEEIEAFEKALRAVEPYAPENARNGESLMNLYEACYVGMLEDCRFLVPREVKELYGRLKDKSFEEERKKVSYVLGCVRASEKLYGIVPLDIFMKLVGVNTQIELTEEQTKEILGKIPPEFMHSVVMEDKLYREELCSDYEGLLLQQGEKEYYIPTLEEILDFGKYGCLPNDVELKRFVGFLEKELLVPEMEAYMAASLVQAYTCGGRNLQDVIDILNDFEIEVKNDRQMDKLIKALTRLRNNTRTIMNRGFTPNELKV